MLQIILKIILRSNKIDKSLSLFRTLNNIKVLIY